MQPKPRENEGEGEREIKKMREGREPNSLQTGFACRDWEQKRKKGKVTIDYCIDRLPVEKPFPSNFAGQCLVPASSNSIWIHASLHGSQLQKTILKMKKKMFEEGCKMMFDDSK